MKFFISTDMAHSNLPPRWIFLTRAVMPMHGSKIHVTRMLRHIVHRVLESVLRISFSKRRARAHVASRDQSISPTSDSYGSARYASDLIPGAMCTINGYDCRGIRDCVVIIALVVAVPLLWWFRARSRELGGSK